MTSINKKQVSVYIQEDLHSIIKKAAFLKGMSVSSYLGVIGVEVARKQIKEIGKEILEKQKNEKKRIHTNE